MWTCPKCGRTFKRQEQEHYCGKAPETVLSRNDGKEDDNGRMNFMELQYQKKDVTVCPWELEHIKSWSTDSLRNWIWLSKENGQPIPGCVSCEALRMELIRRGEQPNGFHENLEDVDVSHILIEQATQRKRNRGRR